VGEKMKPGTVVIFNTDSFNPEFWSKLSEEDKIKYYGSLGYGSNKKKFFVFLTEVKNAPGHCILVDLDDGHLETMRHTYNFREVTEEEF